MLVLGCFWEATGGDINFVTLMNGDNKLKKCMMMCATTVSVCVGDYILIRV